LVGLGYWALSGLHSRLGFKVSGAKVENFSKMKFGFGE
jgi:hypothetical protein